MIATRPLVVHLIYRLDFGGLETLLVECINRLPENKYRHAIICLTDYTAFSKKIADPSVEIFALHKLPGLGLSTHVQIWKLLRKLKPAILHTYNLATIEYAFTATLAAVPIRIHAEHGRDAGDPDGKNRKHNFLRRWLVPFIDAYIPVSADLQHWLKSVVGIPEAKIQLITNGVDTIQFKPVVPEDSSQRLTLFGGDCFVIGTVGRIQDVKNHAGLIDAFIRLQALMSSTECELRLVIVGDGPLLAPLKEKIAAAGIGHLVWLPGARTDIADIMRTFDLFVLPSIAEGTPVTVLEAMASGLAVVATRVGGLPEVITDQVDGLLVPPSDTEQLAAALQSLISHPAYAKQLASAGRAKIERHYSIAAMLSAYAQLYDTLLSTKTAFMEPVKSCAE